MPVQTAKYLHASRSLLMRKCLLVIQADYLHARASEIYCELSISQVKSDLLYGIQGTCQSEREQANKSALTQAKACTQNSGGDRGGRGGRLPPKATKNCINLLGADPRLAHLSGHCWALPPHRKILATPLTQKQAFNVNAA